MLPSKADEMDSTFAFNNRRNKQKLFISKDTFRLMEVVNGLIAKIYERSRSQNTNIDKMVTWNHVSTITQFPSLLQGANNANFLFSPNFDRYIDVIYSEKRFCIRDVITDKTQKISSDDVK